MRLHFIVLLIGMPLASDASFVVTGDGRVIETVCEISANEEETGEFATPDVFGASWSETVTACNVGFAGIDSTVAYDVLAATVFAQAGRNSGFEESGLALFYLEFEVTEASLVEWMDGSGTRLETLLPGTTYTIHSEIHAVDERQGRLESSGSVRLIPEPATMALVSLGLVALASRCAFTGAHLRR